MRDIIVAIKEQMEASKHTSTNTIGGPRFVTERVNALLPDGIATLRLESDKEHGSAIHSVMFTFELLTPDTDGLIWRDKLFSRREG